MCAASSSARWVPAASWRRRVARRGPRATARAFSPPPLLLREFFLLRGVHWVVSRRFNLLARVRRTHSGLAVRRVHQRVTHRSVLSSPSPRRRPPPPPPAINLWGAARPSPHAQLRATRCSIHAVPPVSSASLLGGCARGEGCAGRKKWDTAGSLSTSPSLSTFTGRLTKTISMLGGQCLPLRRTLQGCGDSESALHLAGVQKRLLMTTCSSYTVPLFPRPTMKGRSKLCASCAPFYRVSSIKRCVQGVHPPPWGSKVLAAAGVRRGGPFTWHIATRGQSRWRGRTLLCRHVYGLGAGRAACLAPPPRANSGPC